MITSAKLIMIYSFFIKNKGDLFLLIYSNLTLNLFTLYDHLCVSQNSACFLTSLVNSLTNVIYYIYIYLFIILM